MASFQETLRPVAIFDEGFVTPGSGLGLARMSALDPSIAALLQVGVSLAIGSSAVCLEWSAAGALAAGATRDEITDVLLAIAPVAGMGRVVSAAPGVAIALGYDIEAALEVPDHQTPSRDLGRGLVAAGLVRKAGLTMTPGTLMFGRANFDLLRKMPLLN